MTEQEINRAIQYVVASTSYGKPTVADIVRTGFEELASLASSMRSTIRRDDVLEYVVRWTMARTGQDEALVREVLICAGRWLDEVYEAVRRRNPELLGHPDRAEPPT